MANSPKYHPIAEKLFGNPFYEGSLEHKNWLDANLKFELEACAEKLSKEGLSEIIYWEEKTVREILGLGDVEAKGITDCGDMDHQYGCDCKKPPKETPTHVHKHPNYTNNECDCSTEKTPKQTGFSGNVKDSSQKIIFHASLDCPYTHKEFPSDWLYCPFCAAPKPKPLSLEERLAQYLYEEFEDKHKVRLFEVERVVQDHYMKLAGKVIAWLKENE